MLRYVIVCKHTSREYILCLVRSRDLSNSDRAETPVVAIDKSVDSGI